MAENAWNTRDPERVALEEKPQAPGWRTVAAAPPAATDLPGGSSVLVCRERTVKVANASTAHYYITSLRGTAEELGRLVRRHWSVENELHWVLDVAFGEDSNRTAAGHAGVNLGLIRRVAASLLQQDPGKGSIRAKRLSAALDEGYLMRVLRGFQAN